ncbi:MAG: RNA ligase [Archaeoglobaceae archaeon]|nr:RNA ligase [Archaeoglobaceae archaeon]MDW7989154.1 RNA ligase [Archaeoglobaceae archaeon]
MSFVAEALNLSKFSAEQLKERGILKKAFIKSNLFDDIVEAYRIDKKFGIYEEGTVVIRGVDGLKVVRGFPKIKRILFLENGLIKHFGNRKIAIEEKMNGYNVRIVKIGKKLYAITRGGLICPYTTEKVREKLDEGFFHEYPDFMLCCEAVGKASPYVTDYYGIEGLEFFLFDIRECRSNVPMSIEKKEKIAKKFGLKTAEILKKCFSTEIEEIKNVIKNLDERGREGVVFKDIEMKIDPLKYTTSFANCSDLAYAFKYFEEHARDFMLARIMREAFQAFEFGDSEDRASRLGKAILLSAMESIKRVKEGEEILETSKLSFSNEEVYETFKMHMKLLGISFREIEIKRDERTLEVVIAKVMRATTDKVKSLLEGNPW